LDALKRNRGDMNAAAEWLLSMPTYVAVNSTNDNSSSSISEAKAYNTAINDIDISSYDTQDIRSISAKTDSNEVSIEMTDLNNKFASKRKNQTNDDDDSDGIELFSGLYEIRGRNCNIIITQVSIS
jgi:hypothetical protein